MRVPLWQKGGDGRDDTVVAEVLRAATTLSQRGIGALIPQTSGDRPVDVFFPAGDATAEPAGASSAAEAPSTVALAEVPGATLTRLPLDRIVPNRAQPRTEFDEEALEELTHSIREFGVFQPIVVRGFSKYTRIAISRPG